jgi:hypothetical protein
MLTEVEKESFLLFINRHIICCALHSASSKHNVINRSLVLLGHVTNVTRLDSARSYLKHFSVLQASGTVK